MCKFEDKNKVGLALVSLSIGLDNLYYYVSLDDYDLDIVSLVLNETIDEKDTIINLLDHVENLIKDYDPTYEIIHELKTELIKYNVTKNNKPFIEYLTLYHSNLIYQLRFAAIEISGRTYLDMYDEVFDLLTVR